MLQIVVAHHSVYATVLAYNWNTYCTYFVRFSVHINDETLRFLILGHPFRQNFSSNPLIVNEFFFNPKKVAKTGGKTGYVPGTILSHALHNPTLS